MILLVYIRNIKYPNQHQQGLAYTLYEGATSNNKFETIVVNKWWNITV
jgi:hypothetical protein